MKQPKKTKALPLIRADNYLRHQKAKVARKVDSISFFGYHLKDIWQVIPLAIIAAICLYVFVQAAPYIIRYVISPSSLLMDPTLPTLMVAIFSILYIYKVLKRKTIRRSGRTVASLFSVLLIASLTLLAFGIGRKCTGFFGTLTDCTTANLVTIFVLLFNPYSLLLWSLLSIIGILSLFSNTTTKK